MYPFYRWNIQRNWKLKLVAWINPNYDLQSLRDGRDGVQSVILDSPEIYSGYAFYSYAEDMKDFIDQVK